MRLSTLIFAFGLFQGGEARKNPRARGEGIIPRSSTTSTEHRTTTSTTTTSTTTTSTTTTSTTTTTTTTTTHTTISTTTTTTTKTEPTTTTSTTLTTTSTSTTSTTLTTTEATPVDCPTCSSFGSRMKILKNQLEALKESNKDIRFYNNKIREDITALNVSFMRL